RSGQALALHYPLHREGSGDVERDAGIVTFTVAGCAFDDRRVIGDARLLRALRNAVDVGTERDDRPARPPARDPSGREPRDIPLHLETVLLEDSRQVLRCLNLLVAQLAEAEHHVDHLLSGGEAGVDVVRHLRLQRRQPAVVLLTRGRDDERSDQRQTERSRPQHAWHTCPYLQAAYTGGPTSSALFAPARGRNFCRRPLPTSAM